MSWSATSTCVLNPSRDGDSTTALGSLVQCLMTLSLKTFFPNIQFEPPLTWLEATASHPITSYLGEETNTCLTRISFQVVVESNKVSPQPPSYRDPSAETPNHILRDQADAKQAIQALQDTGEQSHCLSVWLPSMSSGSHIIRFSQSEHRYAITACLSSPASCSVS